MKTLAAYLDKKGSKTLTALAGEVGISKSRLSQLRDATDWPPALALAIEKATNGTVSASRLCPVIAEARKTAA